MAEESDATEAEPRLAARRRELIEAAARVIAESGMGALSARNVAAESGLSTKPVYSEFGSMEALVRAVVTEGFDRLEARLLFEPTDDPIEDAAALTRAYVDHARDEPALYAVMFGVSSFGHEPPVAPGELIDDRRRTLDRVSAMWDRAKQMGRIHEGSSATLSYRWWTVMHGYVALESSGFLGKERGPARILGPILEAVIVAEGDSKERAHESISRGLARTDPTLGV